jgi:hypothetical protein
MLPFHVHEDDLPARRQILRAAPFFLPRRLAFANTDAGHMVRFDHPDIVRSIAVTP